MAIKSKKRPAEAAAESSQPKTTDSAPSRERKRHRKSSAPEPQSTPAAPSTLKPEPEKPVSLLRTEEKAFPRGGGSALTPLEYKQIQIKATQDVLFEQGGAKQAEPDSEDEDGSNAGDAKETTKKPRKSRSKADRVDTTPKEDVIKPEGLSYKVRTLCLSHAQDHMADSQFSDWYQVRLSSDKSLASPPEISALPSRIISLDMFL